MKIIGKKQLTQIKLKFLETSIIVMGAIEGSIVGGLIKDKLTYPDTMDKIRNFLENNPEAYRIASEKLGSNNIEYLTIILYGEKMSLGGITSSLLRDVGYPLIDVELSLSGAVAGAFIAAIYLYIKIREVKREKKKEEINNNMELIESNKK